MEHVKTKFELDDNFKLSSINKDKQRPPENSGGLSGYALDKLVVIFVMIVDFMMVVTVFIVIIVMVVIMVGARVSS